MEWPFVWKSEYDRVAFLLAQKDRDFWDVSEERDVLQEKLDNADVAISNLQERIKELNQDQDALLRRHKDTSEANRQLCGENDDLRRLWKNAEDASSRFQQKAQELSQWIKAITSPKPKPKPKKSPVVSIDTVGKPKRKIVKKK